MSVLNYNIMSGKKRFISVWDTRNTSTGSSAVNQISLPLVPPVIIISLGEYDALVDWGDGSSSHITAYNQPEATHTYAVAGIYTITVTGLFKGFQFANSRDRLKILSITNWGCLQLTREGAFWGCANLDLSTTRDVPDLSFAESAISMFRACTTLTTINRLNEWDWHTAKEFNNTFQGCTNFNQDINWKWNSVTEMVFFMEGCSKFNSIVTSTSPTLINLQHAFRLCPIFNRTLSNINTDNVTNFASLLYGASAYNQPFTNNTSAATNIASMFEQATAFNQNLGAMNISNVTNALRFMAGKGAANYSTSNMDAIYNGWIVRELRTGVSCTFGTIKYTAAGSEGKALLTRPNATVAITNAINNGVGLIRITATSHGLTTNNKVFIKNVGGVTNANGLYAITVIDANTLDLQGSSFAGSYTTGGTLIKGYGWTITDGGI